jgi:hypothetical protein
MYSGHSNQRSSIPNGKVDHYLQHAGMAGQLETTYSLVKTFRRIGSGPRRKIFFSCAIENIVTGDFFPGTRKISSQPKTAGFSLSRIKNIAAEPSLRATRDRCYYFKNIFAEKNCEKIGVFDSKQS